MNGDAKTFPRPAGAEWVPTAAVCERQDVYPRGADPRGGDLEAVRHYASTFWQLPPIRVQKDTFVVIDGSLRLEAADHVGSLCILVVEEDVSNSELVVEAFKANLHHGLPYEEEDRRRGLMELLHIDESGDPWVSTQIELFAQGVDGPDFSLWLSVHGSPSATELSAARADRLSRLVERAREAIEGTLSASEAEIVTHQLL